MIVSLSVLLASVTFVSCPKCERRFRISDDGLSATVNLCRLDGTTKEAMAARAERYLALGRRRPTGDARRPMMGWSSWNTFGLDISEEIILGIARAMATNGLKAAGYLYVNIDDGFFDGHDEQGRLRWHPTRFPRGMKGTVDGIHALGLRAGTYSDAGANTCGSANGKPGGDPSGLGAGLYGHDAADCRLHFGELGFDFFKVDFCGGIFQGLDERTRYSEIAAAIRATGRTDVRLNICRWAFPGTWAAEVAASWRTTKDIRANWKSVRDIVAENLYLSAFCSPGHFNDMDMLEVGRLAGSSVATFAGDTGLTRDEETTHFGLWCLMSSPLLLGCDPRQMSPETLRLVTNPYLLAMNQDALCLQAEVVARDGEAYVLAKDAETRFGLSRYVALYNAGDTAHAFVLRARDVDLGGRIDAFDLVDRADCGSFSKAVSVTVAPHATRLFRLDGERRLERTVYEAETAYLTDYQELRDAKEAKTATHEQVPEASGGVAVTTLGNRLTNDLVFREVNVLASGRRRLVFCCRSAGERRFAVEIDGVQTATLTVSDTAGAFVPVACEADLTAGTHAIRLSNGFAPMPDLDCLRLELPRPVPVSPQEAFARPPDGARLGVWWHWMGRQVTKEGIVRDLDWMREMKIGSATVFAMADATTPWAKRIANVPTDIGHPYSDAWWECFRFACAEGKRRGIGIGLHNCPGYTSTGGAWIPPELAMRELVFDVKKPEDVSLEPSALFPVYNEDRGVFEKPACPARRTDLRDIATVKGVRVSHVPMGAFVQPCDWHDFGLECDKMNPAAVRHHLDKVFGDLHRVLGPDLRAAGLTHILLDSYEAGMPNWTPNMADEFKRRRGYDPVPFLPVLGGFTNLYAAADVKRFRADFDRTVRDLYRDVLFRLMGERVRAEGLDFSCEPYGGPFETAEAAPHIDRLMTEFWYDPHHFMTNFDCRAWRKFRAPDGGVHNVIEAEAFTGIPQNCAFTETPVVLKRCADSAFLAGVNRFVLHTVVHQPWGDDVKPGVTMGRWGTHFGRNQVWGEAGRRWFDYCLRCQALLQWGAASEARLDVPVDQIARTQAGTNLFFLVNRTETPVALTVSGAWFDPVSGKVTRSPKTLAPTQSGFLLPGAVAAGEPEAYDLALFEPPTTWAKLLAEDERYPADVSFAPAPLPDGGQMMLAYPDWFGQGMKARPTPRKYFATWQYNVKEEK